MKIGKTHFINKTMKENQKNGSILINIRINEEFDVKYIIENFRDSNPSNKENPIYAVHFNISSFSPLEKINQFFFNLIFTNIIIDPIGGDILSIQKPNDWTFFVEIPRTSVSEKATMMEVNIFPQSFYLLLFYYFSFPKKVNNFVSASKLKELPSIKYTGIPHIIEKNSLLEIDENSTSICYLLKAFLEEYPIDHSRKIIDLNNEEVEREGCKNYFGINYYILKLYFC